ncbi:MAG TPA: flagellar biosynthesis anti-sigma factor FlgM [Clostridia bacterium]|nr:flagellar biosynthesis anti-sigma factor FlgM [Clostridia bacterium]
MIISQKQAEAVLSAYRARLARAGLEPMEKSKSSEVASSSRSRSDTERQVQNAPGGFPGDQVIISSTLRRITEAGMAAESSRRISEVDAARQVRVKELKRLVAEGRYEVSSEEIAEKIIARLIADELQ